MKFPCLVGEGARASIRSLLSFLRPSKASVEPVSRTDDPGMVRVGTLASGEPWMGKLPTTPDVLVKREHKGNCHERNDQDRTDAR